MDRLWMQMMMMLMASLFERFNIPISVPLYCREYHNKIVCGIALILTQQHDVHLKPNIKQHN